MGKVLGSELGVLELRYRILGLGITRSDLRFRV
jgi:hypothetical protein